MPHSKVSLYRGDLVKKGIYIKGSNKTIREYVRRHRISFMAALDQTGIIGGFAVDNAFTESLFNMVIVIETEILPHLGSFCHGEPRSVVVMDNCSIHNDETIALIQSKGAIAMFLPPYSPDLNPIEMAFKQMKSWLKSNQDIALQHPKTALIQAAESITS